MNKLSKNFLFLLIGFIIVCGLFLPLEITSLWWREALNSSHVILFFLISLVLYSWLSAKAFFSNSLTAYIVTLIAGLLLGLVIELLQGVLQRESSVDDLYRNFFGIVSGLFFAFLRRQKKSYSKILPMMCMFACLTLGMWSLFQISWHYLQRDKAFPMIAEFSEKWTVSFLRFKNAEWLKLERPATAEKHELFQIKFDSGKYSGVAIIEPERDWSNYNKLRFKIFSANEEMLTLILRIHDVKHNQNYSDRFNKRLTIRPGLNKIAVNLAQIREGPSERQLDLSNIQDMQLFLVDINTPLVLSLGNLYLEK